MESAEQRPAEPFQWDAPKSFERYRVRLAYNCLHRASMGLREKLRAGNSRCHAGSAHRIPPPAADPCGRKIRCDLGRAKTNRSLQLACDPRKRSSRTLSLAG